MEHCYRIALWMFCVIACIQAMPRPKRLVPTEKNLGLDLILEDIECGNVKFLSQDKNKSNSSVAIKCIFNELLKASTNCTGERERINATLESLLDLMNDTLSDETVSPDFSWTCPWTTRMPLKEFVGDAENFFQELRAKKDK